jgi:hypothetical protein
MVKNIDTSHAGLDWDPAQPGASLATLRAYVEAEALKGSSWYMERKNPEAFWSRSLRLWAIITAAAGGL